jgi:hypothetical protein
MMPAPLKPAAARDWPKIYSPPKDDTAVVPRPWRLADFITVALLLLIAGGLRLYLVAHTEVAARDSIGYIRYARQLEAGPWQEVVRKTEQPPLYALAVSAASGPVRQLMSGPESVLMQRSAQLVSALAGILLVLPMYFLGRELFERRIAFWAVLLFQCLPTTGRFLSDGISESLFLLLVATAVWLGVRSLRTCSALGFAASGICGGLAYLTRIEGGLVVAAVGLVLLGRQAVRGQRVTFRRLIFGSAALGLGALAVAGPYMAVIGGITNKQSIHSTLQNHIVESSPSYTAGFPLAVWWEGDPDADKSWWALWALGTELSRGAFHIGLPAALLGLWVCREKIRRSPGMWLLLLLSALMAIVLWRLAKVMGYLSDRHCLVILFCAMYWIAAGFQAAGEWIAGLLRPYLGEWTKQKGLWRQMLEERFTSGRALAALLLLAMLAVALPKSIEPLHGNRAGLRQAGLWLLDHADPCDQIVDPYCWSHYYAGCVFRENTDTSPTPGHTPVRYVVLEHSKSEHTRLAGLEDAKALAIEGHEVFHWTGKQVKNKAEVIVYEVAFDAGRSTP